MNNDRRRLLAAAAALGVGPFAISRGQVLGDDSKGKAGEEVAALEDLMREHGVLNRILLIYEEGLRQLGDKEDVPPDVFHKPATLVRQFVEDYHEKLEEKFIFPEFEKQKRLVDLVEILRQQHKVGRKVTDVILRNTIPAQFSKEAARKELVAACRSFIRMYRPHEAREDTVLFPEFHKIVPAKRILELGEQFEKEENRLFGAEGFEKTVDQVAAVEKQLGIDALSHFTAK